MTHRQRQGLGWSAVGLSTLIACFWAFWGIIENFHEGWYCPSVWMNLRLMVVQYLLPMMLFVAAGLVAIYWPRRGGAIHIAAGLAAAWFFRGASPLMVYPMIVGPLGYLGIAYWFGRGAASLGHHGCGWSSARRPINIRRGARISRSRESG